MSLDKLMDELREKFPTIDAKSIEVALSYLRFYGYLNGSEEKADIVAATKQFQAEFGIEQDGLLGPKTIKATQFPRCGCREVEFLKANATGLAKWGIPHITWYVEDYLDEFSKDEMIALIKKGFDYTSSRIELDFEQVSNANKANIVFTASNSPRDEMGKAGGVLAWCELPPANFSGQIITCFDKAETWIVTNGGRGIKYFNVLMHEVCWGHGMGLSHSKIDGCLMAPFYSESVAFPVEPDDESEMFKRYKKRTVTPDPTPTPSPDPNGKETVIHIIGNIDRISIPGYRVSSIS